MRKGYRIGLVVLSVLLLGGMLLLSATLAEPEPPFTVRLDTENGNEVLQPWYSDDGSWYVFLPACWQETNARIALTHILPVRLDGQPVADGLPLTELSFRHTYAVTVGGAKAASVTFLHSENLPALFLSVGDSILENLKLDKNRRADGRMTLLTQTGEPEALNLAMTFSGRGNSTWAQPKKGWGFHLEEPQSLLGMRPSRQWVLFANALDESDGLRNYLVYQMAAQAGLDTTSQVQFLDLYIDGAYCGLYQLAEKIEVSSEKLNIGALEEANYAANGFAYTAENLTKIRKYNDSSQLSMQYYELETPEDFSGGYILERSYGDKLIDKTSLFRTEQGNGFVVRYPEIVSEAEMNYIAGLVQSVENAFADENFTDPVTGKPLEELIDADSWCLRYLVEEAVKNEGFGTTSSYFYIKQGDSRLYSGPVWDFDKSLGFWDSRLYKWCSPAGITNGVLHGGSAWWQQLSQWQGFTERRAELYETRIRPYLQWVLSEGLDAWDALITPSVQMDSVLWSQYYTGKSRFLIDGWIPVDGTPTDYLRQWITERIAFLDSAWIDGTQYGTVLFEIDAAHAYTSAAPLGGTVLRMPFGEKGSQLQWVNAQTQEPFTAETMVTESFVLCSLAQQTAEAAEETPAPQKRASLLHRLHLQLYEWKLLVYEYQQEWLSGTVDCLLVLLFVSFLWANRDIFRKTRSGKERR